MRLAVNTGLHLRIQDYHDDLLFTFNDTNMTSFRLQLHHIEDLILSKLWEHLSVFSSCRFRRPVNTHVCC
jgi:hypothetical protein